ncbi:MAG: hypothetical protein WKG07_50275 [Hymenobacter sp.]
MITVVFPDDMTTYQTRQLVAEKLKSAGADLAAGAGMPSMAPITTGLGEIYQYTHPRAARLRKAVSLQPSCATCRTG